jgi:hypothetical protein
MKGLEREGRGMLMRRGVLRRQLKREIGQALLLVAIAMPLFFGLLALVVDGTNLMVHKRQTQTAADAAALAVAQSIDLTNGACDTACSDQARGYAKRNGVDVDSTTPSWHKCHDADPSHPTDTNCYAYPYVNRNDVAHPHFEQVEVRLRVPVSGFFTKIIGIVTPLYVSARAVGATQPVTTTKVTPGTTSTTEEFVPGPSTGIFARAQICQSFFIPGNNVHVTGVETFGGIGNIAGTGNKIDAIKMNHYFFNQNSCTYTGQPYAPNMPEFWCYDASHTPCDGTGATADWPVPFPSLESLFRDADTHCLYVNATVAAKALQSGEATLIMKNPHCLKVGDTVTVANVDTRFNGTFPVTAVTANTFSYAKSVATFTRSVTVKASKSGMATLTTSVAHGLSVGDVVTVNVGDSRFDGTYAVSAVPTTTTLKYAKTIPTVDVAVTNKALSSGTATLTTASAHNLSAGDPVKVDIGDARFDGSYAVTAVTANTFSYTPSPVASSVTSKTVASGVATLTTSVGHNFGVGNTVRVDIGDPRFDGTFTVTAVPTSTTFSYALSFPTNHWVVAGNTATLTAVSAHGLSVGDSVTVSGFTGTKAFLNCTGCNVTAVSGTTFSYPLTAAHANANGNDAGTFSIATLAPAAATGSVTVTTIASTAASGTVTVPGVVPATTCSPAPCGTVTFTGNVALTPTATGTATFGSSSAATISATSWKTTHPPGIYVVDALNGVPLTISTSNTTFDGYSFVAPEILIQNGGNTFKNFPSAAGDTVFYGYDPSGDVVHASAEIHITGSVFCGPPVDPGTDPQNKCWFGGTGSTFDGLMEAWHIEYKVSNADFNGRGPAIGGTTTAVSTTTTPATTQTFTTGTTVGLGE